ncbi:MAG: glycosyltransferase family 39 protein [Caulobacteraceae bacterium]
MAGAPWPLIAVVVVLSIARLVTAGHVHLAEDEAYYRLWASAPALGYYDHPPMIAWWIWLGIRSAGDSPLGVRLAPIAASALTSFLVFDLARLAGFGRRTSQRAGIWWNATLLAGAGGFLAVPDVPATLFWALSLWCALRAARLQKPGWWAAAGVAAGLATLSKYSAIFLAPGALLWLVASGEGRAELRKPGPWLAAIVAIGLFGLNLWWNAEHHWLTIAKQFGRVQVRRFAPQHLVEFLVGQAALINPLIGVFVVRAILRRDLRARLAPFLLTGAPFAAYLLFHALHDAVQAHWPAPLYPGVAIVAAAGAERVSGFWRPLRRAAPVFGFAIIATALAWLALPSGLVSLPRDPAAPLRGWPAFARALESMRERSGAAWVGTLSFGLAAELSDDRTLQGRVIEVVDRRRYADLRLGPSLDLSRPGLLVDLPRRINLALLRRCFAAVRPAGFIERERQPYAILIVSGPKPNLLAEGC